MRFVVAALMYFIFLSCEQKNMVEQVNTIQHYASGSALAYKNGKIYLMGDDMNYLLILDKSLKVVDSILLEDSAKYKIPKETKSDIEAATFIDDNNLLLLGSGSKKPFRNSAWLVNTATRQKQIISLETFYQQILSHNIAEINIEGATVFRDRILLSNRGNKSYPKNHLIITPHNFYEHQQPVRIKIVEIENRSTEFSGVSGLEYSPAFDRLLLSVSTEDTYDTHSDGAIGKSFIWIVDAFSTKFDQQQLEVNRIIDLSEVDKRFSGEKIESVCILSESANSIELVLVADNDQGNSTLFKLNLSF
jgi:hypothetical protein